MIDILGVKNMMNKVYVDIIVLLLLYIYRRHLSQPARKMCPIRNVSLMVENIFIFF